MSSQPPAELGESRLRFSRCASPGTKLPTRPSPAGKAPFAATWRRFRHMDSSGEPLVCSELQPDSWFCEPGPPPAAVASNAEVSDTSLRAIAGNVLRVVRNAMMDYAPGMGDKRASCRTFSHFISGKIVIFTRWLCIPLSAFSIGPFSISGLLQRPEP